MAKRLVGSMVGGLQVGGGSGGKMGFELEI